MEGDTHGCFHADDYRKCPAGSFDFCRQDLTGHPIQVDLTYSAYQNVRRPNSANEGCEKFVRV